MIAIVIASPPMNTTGLAVMAEYAPSGKDGA
jgi:hypothetical protein